MIGLKRACNAIYADVYGPLTHLEKGMESPPTLLMPTRTSKATRRDVARAAGVSATTVTHALNPEVGGRVNPQTAERVRQVAKKLGYQPSFVGRALVHGRNMTVGVVLPKQDPQTKHQLYQDILYGLAEAMRPDDYLPLVLFQADPGQPVSALEQRRVDGLFVISSAVNDAAIPDYLQTGLPMVVINKDWNPGHHPALMCVRSDHEKMVQDAVKELVELGCRNLMLCIDTRYVDANRLVYNSFINVCGQYREQGVIGTVLNPLREHDCQLEIRNALACGIRWDGVITDKFNQAQAMFEEAAAVGWIANRDYHVITTSTERGQASPLRLERAVYTQDPVTVGATAWRAMKQMMVNAPVSQRTLMIPYLRSAIAEQTLPASPTVEQTAQHHS